MLRTTHPLCIRIDAERSARTWFVDESRETRQQGSRESLSLRESFVSDPVRAILSCNGSGSHPRGVRQPTLQWRGSEPQGHPDPGWEYCDPKWEDWDPRWVHVDLPDPIEAYRIRTNSTGSYPKSCRKRGLHASSEVAISPPHRRGW